MIEKNFKTLQFGLLFFKDKETKYQRNQVTQQVCIKSPAASALNPGLWDTSVL